MSISYKADGERVPPTELIPTAQSLTASWLDLGGEIQTDRFSVMKIWLQVDINDSEGVRFRVLDKIGLGDSVEYTQAIETIGSSNVALESSFYLFTNDVDSAMTIPIDLQKTTPVVQVQVMAVTVGSTPGRILRAHYSLGK